MGLLGWLGRLSDEEIDCGAGFVDLGGGVRAGGFEFRVRLVVRMRFFVSFYAEGRHV